MKNWKLILFLALGFSAPALSQTIKDGSIVPRMLSTETHDAGLYSNLGLSASVSGNALTVALKQNDGSTNASSLKPVKVAFRSATATTGGFSIVSVTGSLSITAAASSTMGAISGKTELVYIYLINNAGTAELAMSIGPKADNGSVVTTVAISGGVTRGVIYSTTARSNVPIRTIGRVTIVNTSGNWSNSPTEVSVIPFATQISSMASVYTPNGYGSTNTKIRKYSGTPTVTGSAITVTQSSTAGDSFTINEAGLYWVRISELDATIGVSVNSNQLTTNIDSITAANKVFIGGAPEGSFISRFAAGDVLRHHSNGSSTGTSGYMGMVVVKISD